MFVNVVVIVPILMIGGAVFAALSDRVLGLVLLIAIPVTFLILLPIVKNLDRLWKLSDEYIDEQNRLMRERLSGIRVIRAFDKEAHEHGRIAHATEEMAKYIIRANVRAGYVNPLCMLVLNLATVGMLLIGAQRLQNPELLQKGLTAGGIIATVQYIALILNGVMMLSWTFVFLPHLKVCVNRVTEVLDLPDDPVEAGDGTLYGGDLTIKGVGFRYPDSELLTLSDIDIEIKEGETAALIGGTGSGKSTLLKLLLAFYPPADGEIALGGHSYSEIGRAAVRQRFRRAAEGHGVRRDAPGQRAHGLAEGERGGRQARARHRADDGICRIARGGACLSSVAVRREHLRRAEAAHQHCAHDPEARVRLRL